MTRFDDIPETALAWHRDGRGAVLATVVETWGSAPRPVGSQLAISAGGEIAGSVSGGCVEGAVVAEAMEALDDAKPRLLTYGISDDDAFAVGLACGGTIRILLEPVGSALLEGVLADLVAARADRRAVALVVDTDNWQRAWIPAPGDFADRFAMDRSGFEGSRFVAIHNPPLRLIVVGAVHVAQPLIQMARLARYDPYLVDPRSAFASDARFPGEVISTDWPDAALTEIGLDARTAVVTLSHDPKIDDPAIETALASDVFYLGSLGSKRTHGKRLERLGARFDDGALARIHAPVGLDIGAKSPAEIAISILAELTERLRRG